MSEMITPEVEQARARLNRASVAYIYASQKVNEATAELARLELLKLAGEREGLNGFSFESEYQYDDEGGYFKTATVSATYDDGSEVDYDEPDYEFEDAMSSFGSEALAVLCGQPEDSSTGQITVAEARTKRF